MGIWLCVFLIIVHFADTSAKALSSASEGLWEWKRRWIGSMFWTLLLWMNLAFGQMNTILYRLAVRSYRVLQLSFTILLVVNAHAVWKVRFWRHIGLPRNLVWVTHFYRGYYWVEHTISKIEYPIASAVFRCYVRVTALYLWDFSRSVCHWKALSICRPLPFLVGEKIVPS